MKTLVYLNGIAKPGIPSKYIVLENLKKCLEYLGYEYTSDPFYFNKAKVIIDFDRSLLGKNNKQPVIYCAHGSISRGAQDLIACKKFLKNTDKIWVSCNKDIEILRFLDYDLSQKSVHIPIPINLQNFFPKPHNGSLYDKSENDLIVGFVGRLHPLKNYHLFLEFINYLSRKMPEKHIIGLVAGEFCKYERFDWYDIDDYKVKTDNYVLDNNLTSKVIHLGHIDSSELNVFYNTVDLLFHPTNMIDENFGMVQIEAWSCGKNFVTLDWGGIGEVCKKNDGLCVGTFLSKTGIRFSKKDLFLKAHENLKPLNLGYSKVLIEKAKKYEVQKIAKEFHNLIHSMLYNHPPTILPSKTNNVNPIIYEDNLENDISKFWNKNFEILKFYSSTRSIHLESVMNLEVANHSIAKNGVFSIKELQWPFCGQLNNEKVDFLESIIREISNNNCEMELPKDPDSKNILKELINLGILIKKT